MTNSVDISHRIVALGCFVPKCNVITFENRMLTNTVWSALWDDPLLQPIRDLVHNEKLRSDIDRDVDLLVREKLFDSLRQELYDALHPRYSVPNTPLEHWVKELLSIRSTGPQGNPNVPTWISDDLEQWRSQFTQLRMCTEYKITFAVMQPNELNIPDWIIIPGLQPMDGINQFVPAFEVWLQSDEDPVIAGRKFPQAHEKLASALSKVGMQFTPLQNYVFTDLGCVLNKQEAFIFMDSIAPAMQRQGFEIIWPQWWHSPVPFEVVTHVHEHTSVMKNCIGLQDILSFRKELYLFQSVVSDDELKYFIDSSDSIVKYNGQWLRIQNKDREELRRFSKKDHKGKITVSDALKQVMTAELSTNPESSIFKTRWSMDGRLLHWIQQIKMLQSKTNDVQLPGTFQGTLREYQFRGFSWLADCYLLRLGACLADDMGLGKTVQWIAFACLWKQNYRQNSTIPALLICPTSVLGNWIREMERFGPELRVYLHYGPNRSQGTAFQDAIKNYDIVITSYATSLRDQQMFNDYEWEITTLDEAQYVKNSSTKLTQFIRNLSSRHRIAMTGTPIENRLNELWSIFEFLNPGYLGSERQFQRAFTERIERRLDDKTTSHLNRMIQPFILRRMKTDPSVIQDLPEKIEQTIYCAPTSLQAMMYEATLQSMLKQLEHEVGIKRRGIILSAITKLKQICNAPEHAMHQIRIQEGQSGKLIRLKEILKESLNIGVRCIVFTQYAAMASLLKEHLTDILSCEIGLMIGRTPRKEREQLVDQFQNALDGPPIVVLSLKTGGFGLNLTRATRLIHYDRWWNPAAEKQATDRAYRIGQTRVVEVYKFITIGTLEESIDRLLESKDRLTSEVVGNIDRRLTELDTQELTALLSLRHELILAQDE